MHKIFVLGESGSGKTSSLRSLDPKTTGIINSDKKTLPLQGWREKYKWIKTPEGKTDLDKSNYIELDKPSHVLATLKAWSKRTDLKTLAVDTITHIITSNYMNDTIGKDFKSYQTLGLNAFKIFDFVRDNSDKNIIIFGHSDEKFNDLGQRVVQMKSYGNMVKDMVPPSFFTTVLMTEVHMTDDGRKYVFRTQSNGPDPAKSPVIFKEDGSVGGTALPLTMPNDIKKVLEALDKFEGIKTI